MSTLKVTALKNPSSAANNIVLNTDGTVLLPSFASNNYLQAQGFGTGNVSNTYLTGTFSSNNYLQSQLGGSSFTGAAGVFSDFSGNATLALRNNFSTASYNVGGFTVASTGITVPSDGYYD